MTNYSSNTYLNVALASHLLKRILWAFEERKNELGQSEVSKYGESNDFIYSEYLADCFVDMHQVERYAMINIVRTLISCTTSVHLNLLEEGYVDYPSTQQQENEDLEQFINQLEIEPN